MRKRAELKAAVSNLERPWEVVEKPPKLWEWMDDEEHYSSLNSGRNGLNVDDRMRKSGNGKKFFPTGVDGPDDGERFSPLYGRNGVNFDGKGGNKRGARSILCKDGDRSNGSGDIRSRRKESGQRFMSKDVNGSSDIRLRKKENERRFMLKDVNGSNRMHEGRDGSGRTQRGSNSIAGRRYGKYTQRTSNNASPRVRDADSEVYDMGLQQDGSYQFLI
uniref:Uncharacterized protein LOC113786976 n=1 Tax=Cicer arietinum TaxID=3827 RepID=A0A3Q7Y133_CICAR|nr:uncharacterized protein LOC113786976 [Cicer arietinum]